MSRITGTGSYIPKVKKDNSSFEDAQFYDDKGNLIELSGKEVVSKLEEITGIRSRRYAEREMDTSDMAAYAGKEAIRSAGIDPETLDYIIAAHNTGDTTCGASDYIPNIASRVKHKLKIRNTATIPYDLPFGCPGWVEGIILADKLLQQGGKALVIGAEALSRIMDNYSRDSMIFSDGSGAAVLEASEGKGGILASVTRSFTAKETYFIRRDASNNPKVKGSFLKMDGHSVYRFALKNMPKVIKGSIDKAGLGIEDISMVLLHQANEKMDEAILRRLYKLYKKDLSEEEAKRVAPMTISWLGNSSTATIPTMLDLIMKEDPSMDGYRIRQGDTIILASVGAGMNINSIVYRH